MKAQVKALLLAVSVGLFSVSALANDVEGQIESINPEDQSFVVQGIRFYATELTDYDDGLGKR